MTASDRAYAIALGAVSGLLVGVVASFTHRALVWGIPFGLAGVIAMVIAFIVFNRTLGGRLGLGAGLVVLVATVVVFSVAESDSIIVPDAFGMILGGTVTVAAVLGMAWPESRPSHRSRLDDESSLNG